MTNFGSDIKKSVTNEYDISVNKLTGFSSDIKTDLTNFGGDIKKSVTNEYDISVNKLTGFSSDRYQNQLNLFVLN